MSAEFELFTPEGEKEAKEYVRITIPKGDKVVADESFREATEQDRIIYRTDYARFKAGGPTREEVLAEAALVAAKAAGDAKRAGVKAAPAKAAAVKAEPPADFMPGFVSDESKSHPKPHKKG